MKPEQLRLIADMVENVFTDLNDRANSSEYWQGIEDFRTTMLEKLQEESQK